MAKTIIKYISRFMLEAETPLFISSGQSSLLKDALVQRDANGFPMIPGTSLAGVLRHSISKSENNDAVTRIFGDSKGTDTATGSLLKVSPGLMMLDQNHVSEGLLLDEKWDFLKTQFENLPVRQHVRMTDKGVAMENGLFDNEVIFKGTRFVFELELTVPSTEYEYYWSNLLSKISNPDFKIGAGGRNGYGSLKVLKMQHLKFNLAHEMDDYLSITASLNDIDWNKIDTFKINPKEKSLSRTQYLLQISPDPFFIFGSGYGDNDVDNTPVEEDVIDYTSGKVKFKKQTFIPGSSVKGAISHRVAYYFNKKKQYWIGNEDAKVGVENEAVVELFGKAGKGEKAPQAGKVYMNDLFLSQNSVSNDKIFNHVAIDRFTGGALEGALFSEKVSNIKDDSIEINLFVEKKIDVIYKEALEEALKDICKGSLPLGGMTTKGHGTFIGKLFENGKEIFSY